MNRGMNETPPTRPTRPTIFKSHQVLASLITSQEPHIFQQPFNTCFFEDFKNPFLSQQKSMLVSSYLDRKSNPLVLVSWFSWFSCVSWCVSHAFLVSCLPRSRNPQGLCKPPRDPASLLWMLCFLVQGNWRRFGENHREPEDLNCQLRKGTKERKNVNKLKHGLGHFARFHQVGASSDTKEIHGNTEYPSIVKVSLGDL